MERNLVRTYKIICIVFLTLFLFALLQLRVEVLQHGWREGYTILDDAVRTVEEDEDAPAGQVQIYCFTLKDINEDYNTLLFYSVHENVRVYVQEECIYSLESSGGRNSWNSPGCVWNGMELTEADNGKRIRVEIRPVYRNGGKQNPVFYFGCRLDIIYHIIGSDLPLILMSLTAIVMGVCYFCLEAYRRRTGHDSEKQGVFGLFLVTVGVWKLTLTSAAGLAAVRFPVLSMIPYGAMPALCVPYILSVKFMLEEEDGWLWDIPCIISLVNILSVVLLQCLGIADMPQTLMITHVTVASAVLFGMAAVIRRLNKDGLQKSVKDTFFFCACCVLWLTADIISYYSRHSRQIAIVGMFCFMVYLLSLAANSAKAAKKLMTVGMQARQYEKIAFHDQLTGFYNRTAYVDYVSNEEFSAEGCIAAVFDLNNLKKCNDSLGHEKGDSYIRESARIIRECLGDIGQCYRVGGDEFYVLVSKSTMSVCQGRMEELLAKVHNFNKNSEDIQMGIAFGFEQYDGGVDRTIEDTVKRADQQMYQYKFLMKKKMMMSETVQGEQGR